MAKIIKFDPCRRPSKATPATHCDHKNVVAFTTSRTVHCESCGAELDTFDVLLELLKGYTCPATTTRNRRDLTGNRPGG